MKKRVSNENVTVGGKDLAGEPTVLAELSLHAPVSLFSTANPT
jgi:hypothetical protein